MVGSKEGDEIWRKISLCEKCMEGEVLPCTTHCPKRGTREGNERGKRHFEESVGITAKLEKGM